MKELLKRAFELLQSLPEEERKRFEPELQKEIEKERLREVRRELVEIIKELRGEKRPAPLNFNKLERAVALLVREGDRLVKMGAIAIAPIFSRTNPKIVILGLNEQKQIIGIGEVIEFGIPLKIKMYRSDQSRRWKVKFEGKTPKIILLAQAQKWIDEVTKQDFSPQAVFLRRLFELPLLPSSIKEEDKMKLLFVKEDLKEEK